MDPAATKHQQSKQEPEPAEENSSTQTGKNQNKTREPNKTDQKIEAGNRETERKHKQKGRKIQNSGTHKQGIKQGSSKL